MKRFRNLLLGVVCIALPAELSAQAVSQQCISMKTERAALHAVAVEQTNGFRECLISFPSWKDTANERYYDSYDVTETIPGQPRRIVISHGRYTSTAYVAPATRNRVERSVEHEDIGETKRLSLFTPEQRLRIFAMRSKAAISDTFLLCRDKLDTLAFAENLETLGLAAPTSGNPFSADIDVNYGRLSKHAIRTCLTKALADFKVGLDPDWQVFRAEFNALPENDRRAVGAVASIHGMPLLDYLKSQRYDGMSVLAIVRESHQRLGRSPRRKEMFGIE